MQMWQCDDKRMAWETSFSGSSGIHAGRERRRSLSPGADVAALATRCGSDWLQRAPSSDAALPAMPAVRQPSLQPGVASGRGARCLRADVAGRALMVPMLKSEGPGRARCGYGSGVVDLTHMRAQTLSQAQRCPDAVAVASAVADKITQTSQRARTHAQTHAHTHTHAHTRAHTCTRTHAHTHTV